MQFLDYEELLTVKSTIDKELNNKRDTNDYATVHYQVCATLLVKFKYSRVSAMRDWQHLSKSTRKKFAQAWTQASDLLKKEGFEKEVINPLMVKLIREDPLLKNPDLESLIIALDRIIYTLDKAFPEYREKKWIPMLNDFLKSGQSDWFKR